MFDEHNGFKTSIYCGAVIGCRFHELYGIAVGIVLYMCYRTNRLGWRWRWSWWVFYYLFFFLFLFFFFLLLFLSSSSWYVCVFFIAQFIMTLFVFCLPPVRARVFVNTKTFWTTRTAVFYYPHIPTHIRFIFIHISCFSFSYPTACDYYRLYSLVYCAYAFVCVCVFSIAIENISNVMFNRLHCCKMRSKNNDCRSHISGARRRVERTKKRTQSCDEEIRQTTNEMITT